MFDMKVLFQISLWIISVTILLPSIGFSKNVPIPKLLLQSKQLILVVTPNLNVVQGKAQLFQRKEISDKWQAIGKDFPIVVGQKGMAFKKKEGDYKSPVGVFPLGKEFGFVPIKNKAIKMQYIPITNTTVCVDDPTSNYYNKIIDSSKVSDEWKSGEPMNQIKGYQYGLVINYNTRYRVSGKGSCVFMHIWQNNLEGTAGCTAMSKQNIKKIVFWLNPLDKPVLVQLPQIEYDQLKMKWLLPALEN